jgi:hypothetical protein
MGKQSISKGQAVVGSLTAKGPVQAGTPGFCSSSVQFVVIRQTLSAGTTAVRSYGAIIPAKFVLEDIYLDVNTQEATASAKTIGIGDATSASAFLLNVSTASAGAVQGSMVAGSVTYGALLTEGTAASGRFRKSYINNTGSAATLVSQVAEAQTEFVGDIILIGKIIG